MCGTDMIAEGGGWSHGCSFQIRFYALFFSENIVHIQPTFDLLFSLVALKPCVMI